MTAIIIEKNVPVPMRDGVQLSANVYRMEGAGPQAVLLARSPYDKEGAGNGDGTLDLLKAVQAGYVLVIQDTRGRFASQGQFDAFRQERQDGYDSIAWAAAQPWSNGAVGMWGGSYLGNAQWLAACEQPPALRAIAPLVGFSSLYDAFSLGGIPLLVGLVWSAATTVEEVRRRVEDGRISSQDAAGILPDITQVDRHLPLDDFPWMQELAPFYFEWLEHPHNDEHWQAIWPTDGHHRVQIPTLNIGGWYDCFLKHTLDNYIQMKIQGDNPLARPRLVIGPWSHGGFNGVFPDREFGPAASVQAAGLHDLHLRWYDHWLKNLDNGLENDKPVKIFVMGIDQWREEQDWPLADAREETYFLHSQGGANSLEGDGALSSAAPERERADIYLYNPLRPAPTLGGQVLLGNTNWGPRDQRPVERREDVLVYTTAQLAQSVEVTGPVRLRLFASTSVRDTDFTAKLVDVFPDGKAILLTEGALRASFRLDQNEDALLEPGNIVELSIDMWATSNVFLAGHHIRLEVSSSNFPRLSRNTNTGGKIAHDSAEECIPAVNHIYHDREHPSCLFLPVIERNGPSAQPK